MNESVKSLLSCQREAILSHRRATLALCAVCVDWLVSSTSQESVKTNTVHGFQSLLGNSVWLFLIPEQDPKHLASFHQGSWEVLYKLSCMCFSLMR